ncbi:uncharacterized protein LOC107039357 [Diachasma alloeum]|uniref:uncharacterized protein LOC107039357 n=1 Tax=Diachasma alloeum TaxID=454923 RepID=UPI0007381933|nr:uncharacterized protein LOC107039357 [Diachasma alloeum]
MQSIWWCCCVLIFVGMGQGYRQDDKEYARDPWRGIPMICSVEDPKNISISCHGVRIVKRVIQQLLESAVHAPRIQITEGISIVEADDGVRRGRTMKNSILGLLQGRELRVKLPSLLPANFEEVVTGSLPSARSGGGGGLGGLGGGGKKGGNNFMILALMMGKMLGAMGFGALGLLAGKALMVSSLALMLSLIVAAKKFASSGSSDGGHHVVYAQEVSSGHGHHTKRSTDDPELSPYSGYYPTATAKSI